jgi:hypothetical protein
MALLLKCLPLAILYVLSGGGLFTEWGRRHPGLVALASLFAILSTLYLGRDIYEDWKRYTEAEQPEITTGVDEKDRFSPDASSERFCTTFNGRRICE